MTKIDEKDNPAFVDLFLKALPFEVWFNYSKNFLWLRISDDEGMSWYMPNGANVGERMAREPEKYSNVYVGDL